MRAEILEIFHYSSYSPVELGAGTDVCSAPLRLSLSRAIQFNRDEYKIVLKSLVTSWWGSIYDFQFYILKSLTPQKSYINVQRRYIIVQKTSINHINTI